MDDRKYEIVSFFDKCRWEEQENYGECNYCSEIKEEDNELRLLVHWLSYITDRQIDFRYVWDVGAYVFSKLVYEYKNGKKKGGKLVCQRLLRIQDDSSSQGDFAFVRTDKKTKNDNGEEDYVFSFKAKIDKNNEINKRMQKYIKGDYVYFKSRFYTPDFLAVYKTLYILEKYEYKKSFGKYINKAKEIVENKKGINEEEALIKGLAKALYLLTYSNDKTKEEYIKPKDKKTKREDYFGEILNTEFEDPLEKNLNLNFNKYDKRLWCALRDYIKSKKYNKYFLGAIEDNKLFVNGKSEYLKYLELPGDVWNNNPMFSECLFEKEKTEDLYYDADEERYIYRKQIKNKLAEKSTKRFNKFLRETYDPEKHNEYYPEQFDITFNFVPRMCATGNNCDICPFGVLNGKSKLENFKKICRDNNSNDGYCTVALICCGYKVKCRKTQKEGDCKLLNILEWNK